MKNLWWSGAIIALLCTHVTAAFSQISFTANDPGSVPAYNGYFMYGTNGGYYGTSWDDKSIADIAAGNPSKSVKGVGSKSFRPPLPEYFMEYYGYDIRIAEFNHYASLGVLDNTVMLNQPSTDHKDNNKYEGCADESMMFKNLYEPIWDGGANGTPVNENNYYAAYVYKTVTKYKSYVKFWEIVNEPDFTWAGNAWKDPDNPGNWWLNNPGACELSNMKIPIYYYIHMLRISYEVIKYVDPTAYVAPGGLGYPSFLDALLRNTDNPTDGSITAEYPVKGGAYFDVLSFHSYPMYDLKTWDNSIGDFAYWRHSDAAADEYIKLKNKFDSVLIAHGYNGTQYPKKLFICTEFNIPSRSIDYLIGSAEAQRSYMIKALVNSQKNGILQAYMFVLGNAQDENAATDPFALMGLYKRLEDIGPFASGGAYNQQYTDEGISFKTTSDILLYSKYDATRTALLQLPANIDGAAFNDGGGNYTYVLWAKTTVDQSEVASATYSFPGDVPIAASLIKREWNYSATGASSNILSSNIALTSSPIFLNDDLQVLPIDTTTTPRPVEKQFELRLYPNPATVNPTMKFTLQTNASVTVNVFDTEGKQITTLISGKSFVAGTHVVTLNGVMSLPAGVYYCSFETGIIKLMKKLVVIH
ncbi:MAG: T9SS type A sorting domain-containing protein [Chitinophagaceae bacterium]